MNYSEQKHINGRDILYGQVCGRYTDTTSKLLCVWVDGVCVLCIY